MEPSDVWAAIKYAQAASCWAERLVRVPSPRHRSASFQHSIGCAVVDRGLFVFANSSSRGACGRGSVVLRPPPAGAAPLLAVEAV